MKMLNDAIKPLNKTKTLPFVNIQVSFPWTQLCRISWNTENLKKGTGEPFSKHAPKKCQENHKGMLIQDGVNAVVHFRNIY